MAGKGLPLILAGGAALLLMGGKKKKSTKKAPTGNGNGGGATPYEEIPPGEEPEPYTPAPAPKPKSDPSRPAGSPPRGNNYDGAYWGSTTKERLEGIRRHFAQLGYPVDVVPYPMNILGPKGTMEMQNYDGTAGKLGGDDDQPEPVVRELQHDYNRISRLNKAEKFTQSNMGGLDEDGAVGPYTLNGLRHAKEVEKASGKSWDDLLLMAKNKGIA